MADWIPYLRQLYGRGAEAEMHTLLRYRLTILDPRLQPADRIEIIDWFAEQPVNRQLFAIPQLTQTLAYRSAAVTRRMIAYIDELLGGAHTAALEQIQTHLSGSSPADYVGIYQRVIPLLRKSEPPLERGDYSLLGEHRLPIALLALLTGVEEWRREEEPQQRVRMSNALFDSAETADLIALFDEWLHKAHSFVRWQVVQWIDRCGISTWGTRTVREVLRDVFYDDLDPNVAGGALEALAQRKKNVEEASEMAALLLEEYDTLASAERRWDPHVRAVDATRELSIAMIRALGILARNHPESDAIECLRTLVTETPTRDLNLHAGRRKKEQSLAMFRAALRLLPRRVRVRLRFDQRRKIATAGFDERLRYYDKKRLRQQFPDDEFFWAVAEPSEDDDPCTWTYVLTDACGTEAIETTPNLRGVLSPALMYEATESLRSVRFCGQTFDPIPVPKKRWPLQEFLTGEVDDRGTQIAEAYIVCSDLFERHHATAPWMLSFLRQASIAASCITYEKPVSARRGRLKDIVRRNLLSRLARPEVFEAFIPDEERPEIEYSVVGEILDTALGAQPGDSALEWVTANPWPLLGIVRNDRINLATRGRIAYALLYSGVSLPEHVRREVEQIELSALVVKRYTAAVRFVPEQQLTELLASMSAGIDRPLFRKSSKDAVHWGSIWMERLARAITGHPDAIPSLDVEDAAARCIQVITLTTRTAIQSGEQAQARAITETLALRLADALGSTELPLDGNLRRLRDIVVRFPGSSVLRQYIRSRTARTRDFDADWTRILVRLLDRSDLQSQAGGPRATSVKEIVERLARRRALLAELRRQSVAGRHDFLVRYLHLRGLDVSKGDREGWVAVEGSIFFDGKQEVIATLRDLDDAPVDVASNTSLAAFVHEPPRSERFRAIATRQPLPADAIDFHALDEPPDERLQFAIACLDGRDEIIAVGRADQPHGDRVKIDAGVPGATKTVEADDLAFGERVLVRLRLTASVESARIRPAASEAAEPMDLRRSSDPVGELRQFIAQGEPVLLRATVDGPARSEGEGRYRLKLGFRIDGRPPIVVLPGQVAANAQIVVAVSHVRFATDRALSITSWERLPTMKPGLVSGRLGPGSNQNGGREWFSGFRDRSKIARRAVTADLRTLYAVDRIPDGDDRLKNLSYSAQLRNGEASIIAAPARYNAADLMLAVAADEVEVIVFVRAEPDGSGIFEIVPLSRTLARRSAVPLFGALVRLQEGDLFHRNGRPFAITAMEPGRRIYLTIVQGHLRRDGSWSETEVETAAPLLRVISSNDINRSYVDDLAPGQAVRVRFSPGMLPYLLERPAGLPQPAITWTEGRWPNDAIVDALVKSWDPYATNLKLEIAKPRSRDFGLRGDTLKALYEWVYLHRGDILESRPRFQSYEQQLNIWIRNCLVRADWTLQWLTPGRVAADALNEKYDDVNERGLLITDVPRPRLEPLVRVPASDLNSAPDRSVGVVVSLPHPSQPITTAVIHWLVETDDEVLLGDVMRVDLAPDMLRRVHIGDLVWADPVGAELQLQYGSRALRGTPLCRWYPAPEGAPNEILKATLLSAPHQEVVQEDGGRIPGHGWLFVIDPGIVIEISEERLAGSEQLDGRLLDIATLVRAGRWDWRVSSVEPGHLARAASHSFEARLWSSGANTFARLRSTHPEFDRWPEIVVRASGLSFSRGSRGQGNQLTCAVRNYFANIDVRLGDFFSFDLQAVLTPPRAAEAAPEPELPSLLEELAETGRLDEVKGVVMQAPDGNLHVQVTSHRHPVLLPLAREEETWVPYSRERVRPDRRGLQFTAVLQDGQPMLSLRRQPPFTLGEWLDEKRLAGRVELNETLFYAGPVTKKMKELIGGNVEGVLFEHRPGDCIVIPQEDLLFRDEPFDLDMLAPGEMILRYRIVKAGNRLKLDVVDVRHDIVGFVKRFDRLRGILVVSTAEDLPLRERLSTVTGEESINFGEWTLRLEDLPAEVPPIVYAKFERQEHGVIHCRVLSLRKVFQKDNLVYVRGVRTMVQGERPVARVVPLCGDPRGDYFISDTRYSERRWYLELQGEEVRDRIFLASVDRIDNKVWLALTTVPPRRIGSVLRAVLREDPAPTQVLVKDGDIQDEVYIELAPGFNGVVPFSRFAAHHREHLPALRQGDILFLALDSRRSRLEIVRRIESHRERLDADSHPTVLVKLWGKQDSEFRQRQWQHEGMLKANIVGFPQLKAKSEIRPEHVNESGLLPQMVEAEKPHEDFIELVDRIGTDVQVGRLNVDAPAPYLELRSGGRFQLTWPATLVRFDCHDRLRSYVENWRWRDFADEESTIFDSRLIGQERDGRFSLRRGSTRPYPVDHVVEQFGPKRVKATRVFTVAGVEKNCIILEVSPGRYAEVPTVMIEPLGRFNLAPGRAVDWTWLRPDDRIHLELRPSRTHPYLPNFGVLRVETSVLRHLDMGVTGPLRRAGDHVLFGPEEADIHLDDLTGTVEDVELDLHAIPRGRRANALLQKRPTQAESRLVLIGRLTPTLTAGGETRIDIGLPVRDRRFIDTGEGVDADIPGAAMETVRVRLFDFWVQDGEIARCDYRIEGDYQAWLVNVRGRAEARHRDPERHDVVAVYVPPGGDPSNVRVCGLERFTIDWQATGDDSLQLHHPVVRAATLARLLDAPGAVLWMTVEGINRAAGTIRLSRRRQLQMLAGLEGRIVRAVVRGGVDANRVLIEIAGVPIAITARELAFGLHDARTYGDFLAADARRAQLDVVVLPHGRASATDVYESIRDLELTAEIDFVFSAGLVCIANGTRFHVPLRELAWCRLTPQLVSSIFRRGQKIRIRRLGNDYRQFSHRQISELTREARMLSERLEQSRPRVDELPREAEPVFFVRHFIDSEQSEGVVATPSGMLIGVQASSDAELQERIVYLTRVDLRRHVIEAATERVAAEKWAFAHARLHVPDIWLEDDIKQARLSLVDLILPMQPAQPVHQFFATSRLIPTPRSVRLMLEACAPEWKPGSIEIEKPTKFGLVWCGIADLLAGGVSDDPLAQFGAGYWWLITGHADRAVAHFEAAAESELGLSFDVQLGLARAFFETKNGMAATRVLRSACRRLVARAHGTLRPHVIELADPQVQQAMAKRMLNPLAEAVLAVDVGRGGGADAKARQLWFHMATAAAITADFDYMVKDFLETMADEEDLQLPMDSRLYSIAAQLCFACGDVARGWTYLEQAAQSTIPSLAVERGWSAALHYAGGGDRVIASLWAVLKEVAWRREVIDKTFDPLWETYRQSMYDWRIAPKDYRIVSHPPTVGTQMERWALVSHAQATLNYVRGSVRTEEDEELDSASRVERPARRAVVTPPSAPMGAPS